MTNAILVMVALAAVSPAQAGARFGVQRPAEADPYKKLFEPRTLTQPSIETPSAKPKVVCGMTIIPAEPKVDPKMLRTPKDDGVDYRIRAIDPPICNPSR